MFLGTYVHYRNVFPKICKIIAQKLYSAAQSVLSFSLFVAMSRILNMCINKIKKSGLAQERSTIYSMYPAFYNVRKTSTENDLTL